MFEQRLLDGRWYRIGVHPVFNGWTVGLRTDITKLKNAESALQESELRFRQLARPRPTGSGKLTLD